MSQALYRKYRSRSLDEVLGQDHVTSILRRALEQGKIAHAYLLTGPRGVGKTSVARILAHEINHLPYDDDSSNLDIIEIDAASNNGVDDIRALREKAQVAPVSAPKKVYIIDEVHMLSKSAFNALLKTLEEPPEHVVFILATTDADKLPATILSRVQQFFFHPIPTEIMTRQLMNIAKKEGFAIEEDAARLIAERSHGGFRDGISTLDQLSILATSDQPLTANMVTEYLGLSDATMLGNLLDSYPSDDNEKVLNIFQELENSGANSVVVSHQLLSIARNRLRKNPNLIGLVQQLIEVDRHPHPDLKLLTIFMNSNSQQTEKPVATKKNIAQATTQKPAEKPTPIKSAEPTKPTEKPIEKEEKPVEPAKKPAAKPKKTDAPLELNWEKVIERTKEKSLGLASLLQKSQWSFDGEKLTIYAGSAFYKKKLDDAKNKPLISEIISEETAMDLEIDIIGEKKPPEDEKLAEIAELMGGGEEVKLEDI
ncbi:DNA polymerase III subunit gamma/tau [Candidatus Nanosynbacter sp. TM7-076]|uniref:DNA polymerase III subunit gamma/tau n=1 Tax=Candidatus Nanosynbacter sp. TM7-076 TaxID=2902629 RepID=UPI001FB6B18C|nr:DNA polymerase III subunit gamma/tau [Candidatus Nanosynbacter sp. TM7-076]MCJ1968189.1 DNA polymerase III subunit gamma/tau [Candidatus Nanosynbacter sp. TM7-076]